jgi:hexosaminidase
MKASKSNWSVNLMQISMLAWLFLVLPIQEAASAAGMPGLVPKPVSLEVESGSFFLSPQCRIKYSEGSEDAKAGARLLAETLKSGSGLSLGVQEAKKPTGEGFLLVATVKSDSVLGDEGYRLEVTEAGVTLSAAKAAGLFYGIQTLRQLLPAESFGPGRPYRRWGCALPCLRIVDYPRFGWRGMHLDVSRHFFDTAFIKRYLDNLALHKLNVFHWHLTDDDGWRIEIKKYPRLTRIGAWRGPEEALPASYESGNKRYGGFYTQREVREIVRYAAERHILVVPEVDVPAHCRAVTVAYPELLCAGDPYKFKSVQDVPANVLCPSQEKTYEFLDGVFGELAQLFPGPYLHAGGDERPVGPWEQCERCLKRMKEEHLADGKVLQDRFLKRVQGIYRAHGKRMIGWDELEKESVLEKDYTVMAWNSVDVGIAAARKGYPVILAPSPFTYFDLSYNEDPAEPGQRWAGVISVQKTYSLDPRPANLPPDLAKQILGVHGCLWSETLVSPDRPDYMAFPRLCALAEIGWTPQDQRQWPEFWARLCKFHLPRLDAAGNTYRIPLPGVERNGQRVTLIAPYEGAEVRYSLDGSDPSPASPVYQHPMDVPQGAVLKMRTIRPNGRAGRAITEGQSVKFGL